VKTNRINDDEREQWVANDEGLYLAWKADDPQELNVRKWARNHRELIDGVIRRVNG
jgi:hypothetical protein